MNILFMGTPEFAVPCVDSLVKEKYNVVGVVTQPDKPKGRGHKLAAPPVKEYAVANDIEVFQPDKLKNGQFLSVLDQLKPELIVVVAYGKILPKYILEYPKYGCINVHASLLPKYRGAGPIQWSVINGESETGVTTMYMDEGLDTGDMILKKVLPISPDETAGELHDRMSAAGAEVLIETVKMIADGTAPRIPQPHDHSTYAPMLDKSIALINWAKKGTQIKDLVRGVNPWPVAYTSLEGKVMKVYSVDIQQSDAEAKPGEVLGYKEEKGLLVKAGDNSCISIKEVQFEGGKRMSIHEYLRGHSIQTGVLLGQ